MSLPSISMAPAPAAGSIAGNIAAAAAAANAAGAANPAAGVLPVGSSPDPDADQPGAFKPLPVHAAAISQTKISLMKRPEFTFYTVMLLNMEMSWDTSIPTACTNGLFIKLNPGFFMPLLPDERLFLLCHEVGHVAKNHMSRRGSRTPRRWNKAGDYVINDELVLMGLPMPKGGLWDVNYRGMSTEDVYDLLPEDDPNDPQQDWEDIIDADPNNPQHQHQIQQAIQQAAQACQAKGLAGNVPGDVQLMLDKLMKPKMTWDRILRRYMSEKAKVDYSFAKPNRRFFPEFYLPGLDGQSFGAVKVAVDISGSVSDSDFTQFVSEIREILEALQPTYMDFVQFDTQIHSVDRLYQADDLRKLTFTGRGGTDVTCILEHALIEKPKILLVFTDGEFHMPAINPKCDVIWVIHDNPGFTAPFGKVIHYNINRS